MGHDGIYLQPAQRAIDPDSVTPIFKRVVQLRRIGSQEPYTLTARRQTATFDVKAATANQLEAICWTPLSIRKRTADQETRFSAPAILRYVLAVAEPGPARKLA